jgi:hypothetical protein
MFEGQHLTLHDAVLSSKSIRVFLPTSFALVCDLLLHLEFVDLRLARNDDLIQNLDPVTKRNTEARVFFLLRGKFFFERVDPLAVQEEADQAADCGDQRSQFKAIVDNHIRPAAWGRDGSALADTTPIRAAPFANEY